MTHEDKIYDWDAKARILPGSRVVMDPTEPPGTVIRISDPDGDVDDEGRAIQINPVVWVQWDNVKEGDLDDIHTWYDHGTYMQEDDHWICDELEVIGG